VQLSFPSTTAAEIVCQRPSGGPTGVQLTLCDETLTSNNECTSGLTQYSYQLPETQLGIRTS